MILFTDSMFGLSLRAYRVTRESRMVCVVNGRKAVNWGRSIIGFFLNCSLEYDVMFGCIFIIYLDVIACYFVNTKSL